MKLVSSLSLACVRFGLSGFLAAVVQANRSSVVVMVWGLACLTGVTTGYGQVESAVLEDSRAPQAATIPFEMTIHGDTRVDEYYWMRERENPAVIRYLEDENEYLKTQMADTEPLQTKLVAEMRGRIQLTDTTAPVFDRGYWYYEKTSEQLQYPIYCRKKTTLEADEEVLLDVNQLAAGESYCSVGEVQISPQNNLMVYAVDLVGRRKYSLRVRDLATGQLLPNEIMNVTGNVVWAEDNQTLFYTRQDPETLRPYQVYRHHVGTDSSQDLLVYEEQDEEFSCAVGKTKSNKYLFIASVQTLSTEFRLIDAHQPTSEPKVFEPRGRDHEYSLDHIGDRFVIRTNWDEKNFRLMTCSETDTNREAWQLLAAPQADEFIEGFELLEKYCAIQKRRAALTRIEVASWRDDTLMELSDVGRHEIEFAEPCYVATLGENPEGQTPWLRYNYSSLTTPPTTYEYRIDQRETKVIKQQQILGSFHPENYKTERVFVTARDGAQIPVSIVYRKDTPLDGSAPCFQYGYGSYGYSTDAEFDSNVISLLDRGFVYVLAHVRGGQELGRVWYEDGKLLKKMNTFYDFIDVGKYLIEHKYASKDRLYSQGGSAGGLLIGAVINLEPSLYHGVIADVPFVDVVTTMLDETIPLTTSEYDEWGNPNELEYYDYMLSYSPYDQVEAKEYPHMLVTSGLHDSQVQYWEPTKWVARLRQKKTDKHLLLLKTNMEAGHGGASARDERFKETALRYGFLLKLAEDR
jgi:oligopeptidase B